MDNTRRTITVTVDTASKIVSASQRLGVTKGEVANLIVSMTNGSLETIIPKEQVTLGSQTTRVKGNKFTCPTETVNVDIGKAQRFSELARTIQCSSTWLFEYAATEILDRILRVATFNRHDLPPPIASHVYRLEQNPYTTSEETND
mgnify:CR=1 FL=1|tara:strand:- start:80 stop:517 length:438 start_codon:yes stop_codon:yes gene_type:complete